MFNQPENDAEKELVKTIYRTLEREGKVLMPVFAVGRASGAS